MSLKFALSTIALSSILASPSSFAAKQTAKSANATRSAKVVSKSAVSVPAKVVAKRTPAVKAFVSTKVQKVLAQLKSRPTQISRSESREVEADPMKNSWLQAVYRGKLVESSWATQMLSDKRILSEVLEREIGAIASLYYPKTIGLREFLTEQNLLSAKGEINVDGDRIDELLHEEFPAGFIVRPAVGVAPQETGRGLFATSDEFIVELLKKDSALYQPSHVKIPVKSHILDTIASGEAVVLQENVVTAADARKPLKSRFFNEVRVHTYEGRVVEGAVPERWVQTNLLTKEDVRRAENFVGEFLRALTPALLTKQAWGVDVAVLDNGEFRIIDVVTNRGTTGAWSGYLDQPRVIGAYTRHFESLYGTKFKGWEGTLIRNNFANYVPYWEKRIEKAKPGLSKMLAYFPPVP